MEKRRAWCFLSFLFDMVLDDDLDVVLISHAKRKENDIGYWFTQIIVEGNAKAEGAARALDQSGSG